MNANPEKTCKDKVDNAARNRLEELRVMLNPTLSDVTLGDDGTMDTVIYCGDEEFRYSDTSEYRDEDTGEFDMDYFLNDEWENIQETMSERFFEYGLSFDYVEPDTFGNQPEGYLRYQISYGGPSEELRFYVSPKHDYERLDRDTSYVLHRAEFWYLDWFDGACKDITSNNTARMVFDWFDSCEAVAHAIEEAA